MPYFFIILLKINLVLMLFAGTYYLILRRLTFYQINRLFLLFGILFSSAYPFINLSGLFNDRAIPEFVPRLNENLSGLIRQDSISVYWQLLYIVFYTGVLLMTVRLTIQFISLRRMHRNSDPGRIGEYKVRILKDKVSPFSFWKTIYINPELHNQQDLNNILRHEKVHADEIHTLDIILSEINVVFYWFNPGVWLMKNAVKENIEFITDEKMLKKGINRKAYQYSLLNVGILEQPVAIVNNFNLSDLKKRIKMMNSRPSSPINLSRYLFVLPVLLLTTLAFTISKKDLEKEFDRSKTLPTKESPIQMNRIKKKPGPEAKTGTAGVKKVRFFKKHLSLSPDSSATMPDLFLEGKGLSSEKKIRVMVVKRRNGLNQTNDRTFYFTDTLDGNIKKVFIRLKDSKNLIDSAKLDPHDMLRTLFKEEKIPAGIVKN